MLYKKLKISNLEKPLNKNPLTDGVLSFDAIE